MGLTYTVNCDCGKPISVTSASAGSSITCECGAEVKVPGLSQLRRQAGQEAYASNPIDLILLAHQDGREPAGLECLKCGSPAANIVDLKILCERVEMDYNSPKWLLLKYLGNVVFLGVLFYGLWQNRKINQDLEESGLNNVRTFFRMCDRCLPNSRKPPKRRKIRRMLKQVPVYKELYKENKEAYTKFLQFRRADPDTPVGVE